MKAIRENTKSKFEERRVKAIRELANKDQGNSMPSMRPIKTFAEVADSLQKLRENFDSMIDGKHKIFSMSPLKKKDLMNEFGSALDGGNYRD